MSRMIETYLAMIAKQQSFIPKNITTIRGISEPYE